MSCLMLIERPKVTEVHECLDDDDDGVFVVECCPLVHMTRSMSTSVSQSNRSCSFEQLSDLLVEPTHLIAIVAWNRPHHFPLAQRRRFPLLGLAFCFVAVGTNDAVQQPQFLVHTSCGHTGSACHRLKKQKPINQEACIPTLHIKLLFQTRFEPSMRCICRVMMPLFVRYGTIP